MKQEKNTSFTSENHHHTQRLSIPSTLSTEFLITMLFGCFLLFFGDTSRATLKALDEEEDDEDDATADDDDEDDDEE